MRILTISVIASGSILLAGCGEFKKGFDEGIDKAFKEECMKTASAQPGMNTKMSESLCGCIAKKVDEQFEGIEKISPPEDKMMEIGEQCGAQLAAENPQTSEAVKPEPAK